MEQFNLFKKWNLEKEYTSIGLFKKLNETYSINKVFYPGSYVHITPSLVFNNVTYADSYKNTYKFYEDQTVLEYISTEKVYNEDPKIRFFQQDYSKPFEELSEEFDLIISQYAGFVGQATKRYLKSGGILVCNNSHGDASAAFLDPDYKLIGVYNRKSDTQFSISNSNLDHYFIPKKGDHPSMEEVIKVGKGIGYTKSPSGYIFQKR